MKRKISIFTVLAGLIVLGIACDSAKTPEDPVRMEPESRPVTAPTQPTTQPNTTMPLETPAPTPVAKPVPETFSRDGIMIGQLMDREQMAPGPWAEAKFGDWRIATSEFEMIVSGFEANAKDRNAGNIVDVVQIKNPLDELSLVAPVFYQGDQQQDLKFEDVAIEEGQAPALVFSGSLQNNKNITVRHSYQLDENSRVVRMTTTITNASTETLFNAGIGERVQWGLYVPFIEGFGLPDPAKTEFTQSSWVGGWVDHNTLGIVAPQGKIESAHAWSVTSNRYNNVHQFKPKDTLSATRVFYVGSDDFSEFTDYTLEYRNTPASQVTGRVLDLESGEPIPGIPMRVETYRKTSGPAADPSEIPNPLPYTLTYTDDQGIFLFKAPVGMRVYPQTHDPTREGQPFALIYETVAGQTLNVGDLRVKRQTQLALHVVDDATSQTLPCKVQINQISGPVMNYGPPHQAQGYRNNYYLPTGSERIPVPSGGTYEIVVSRGPEYTVEKRPLTPTSGETTTETVRLKRVVDSKGYIAVDPGVITDTSHNSRVSAKDMVIAAAGEGVEWLVTADANKATDLSPAIREVNLSDWIGSTIGMKPKPRHQELGADFTVFPVEAGRAGEYFSAEYLSLEPTEVLARLRGDFPNSLLMVNRPTDVPGGYFHDFGFTGESIRKVDLAFNYDFDLYEILDGRSFYWRSTAMTYFNRLMLLGKHYIPVGASSSQELLGNEPGYPRTYVGVPDDDPTQVTEDQIVAGLRKGDVVFTNGPFIRFTCQGKRPGDLVVAKDGHLDVELEVWAAPWISVTEVRIDKDQQFFKWFMRPPSEDALRFPLRANVEQSTLRLEVKKDVTLQVRVSGTAGPMQVATSIEGRKAADFPAFAMTGPLFVDGDGDGKFTPPPDGKPRF